MTTLSQHQPEICGPFARVLTRDEIIAYANRMPALSGAAVKVLELLNAYSPDMEQIGHAVLADSALVTLLLKLAEAAPGASTRSINTVDQAIAVIGVSRLRSLALAVAVQGIVPRCAVGKLLWNHALTTALTARKLATVLDHPRPEEVFQMGLLHRLGQFVMLNLPETRAAYPAVLDRIQATGVDYLVAETSVIGFAHPAIGALVANRWNIPDPLCQIMLHYHAPLPGVHTPTDQKLVLVKISSLLAHAATPGQPEGYPVELATINRLARWLGLAHPESDIVPTLIQATQELVAEEGPHWSV